MILSYDELRLLVLEEVIKGADMSQVNGASIDVRLGNDFLIERPARGRATELVRVDMAARDSLLFDKISYKAGEQVFLDPGEFMLACTIEKFYLPDHISAEFRLKSSIARSGLNHLTAVWCDPGWEGSVLTLELSNVTLHHRLLLTTGMPIGQMIFHKHLPVPPAMSYSVRGRYNDDGSVQTIKP